MSLTYLFLGRIVQVLVSAVAVKALSTMLPIDEVGRVYVLLAMAGFANLGLIAPTSQYIQRNLIEWAGGGKSRAAMAGMVVLHLVAALLGAGITIVAWRAGLVTGGSAASGWFVGLAVVGGLTAQTAVFINILGFTAEAVLIGTLASIASLAASVLVLGSTFSAERWVAGQAIGSLAVLVLAFPLVANRLLHRDRQAERPNGVGFSRHGLRDGWRFVWPLMLTVGAYWFLCQGFRVPGEKVLGPAGLGRFALCYAIGGMMIASLETVVSAWIKPAYYAEIAGKSIGESVAIWRIYVSRLIAIYLPFMAFAIGAAPLLAQFVTTREIALHADLAIWGGIIESARVICGLVHESAVIQRNTKLSILPHAIGVGVAVAAVPLLGAKLGGAGLGLALLVAYLGIILLLRRRIDSQVFDHCTTETLVRSAAIAALILVICGIAFHLGASLSYPQAIIACAAAGAVLALGCVLLGRQFRWRVTASLAR